jgi:hypothetical protein
MPARLPALCAVSAVEFVTPLSKYNASCGETMLNKLIVRFKRLRKKTSLWKPSLRRRQATCSVTLESP